MRNKWMRKAGVFAIAALLAVTTNAAGVTNVFIGTNGAAWSVDANWSVGTAPVKTDVVQIDSGDTVLLDFEWLPNPGMVVNVDGTIDQGGALRNYGDVVNVSSSGILDGTGGKWLVLWGGGSEFHFDSGATLSNMTGTIEIANDADITLGFNLASDGFDTVSAGALQINGYAGQTVLVDMAAYAGPTQNIPLIEFTSIAGSPTVTATDFQTLNLVVTNNSGYPASLVWDEEDDTIVLDMGVIEYDVTWDGAAAGLWSNATNWTGDTLPGNGDVIGIDGATVDATAQQYLPGQSSIYLTGASTLTGATVRAQGSTFHVGSQAALTGGWWDFDNGSAVFEDGASATMNFWEFKNDNSFTFNLSASGFTTLTPGSLQGDSSINSNDTFLVDMANYTAPAANIVLVDFSSGGGLTDVAFQSANLIVTNDSGYGATLVWDDATDSIILDMGVIDYDVSWDDEGADNNWLTATNWDNDVGTAGGDVVHIGSGYTANWNFGGGWHSPGNPAAVYLDGTLTSSDALRSYGTVWTIGSTAELDLGTSWLVLWGGGSEFIFDAGATMTNMSGNIQFANDSDVTLGFNLDANGFQTLKAGGWVVDGFAGQTIQVDMAEFSGAPQNITLVDFSGAGAMTASAFTNFNRVVANDSGYGASLVWDEDESSIVLDMGAPTYDVTWDGEAGDGLWSNPTNWTGNALPGFGSVIGIHDADVDWDNNSGSDNLPYGCEIHLTGTSEFETTATLRMAASTLYVGSSATITGSGFWDTDNGTLVFDDGASAGMNNFEFKNANSLTFNVGASGFTALTPGNLHGAGNIGTNDTFIADLAEYTGGAQSITLMDFNNGGGLTNEQFQTANLVITNQGSYTADLEWDVATASIVLTVTDGNAAPVADDQTVYLSGASVAITLSADDFEGDPLSWAIVDSPDFGTLSGTEPILTYTPTGAAVADSFTFEASDATGASTGTVTILPAAQFAESVSAPDTDVLVSVLPPGPGENPEAPLIWSTGDAGIGQSFTLAADTTLSAITVQKHGDVTFDSDTHVLKLWVGEYDTNDATNENYVVSGADHAIGATLHTELIDLSGQSFTSNNYYTISLSSDISLTAGVEYGFELAFIEQDADNRFDIVKYYDSAETGDGIYDGGMTLYAAGIAGTLPFVSQIDQPWNDLAFVLQGSTVAVTDPIGDITLGGLVDGELVFSWDTSAGQNYSVQTNADLTVPAGWGVFDTLIGDGGSVTVTGTTDEVQLFYKVTTP